MSDLISESIQVARKPHQCMAYDFVINSNFDPGTLTFSELRAIVEAKKCRGVIAKGESYLRQAISDGGEIVTFKAKTALHLICVRFDLYEI